MLIDAATANAFERIARRANDVDHAFTPGAIPAFDDVSREATRRTTFDPLCAAPPNDAYFITADASGRPGYSQDGAFAVRAGALVDASGASVLGFSGGSKSAAPLRIDPVDNALGRVQHLRLEADGTLVYDRVAVDPRTMTRAPERVVVGRVALARFPAGTRLLPASGGRVAVPHGVVAHVGTPGDGSFGALALMQREGSRIDLDRSLERLEDAYLYFDALTAAHKARGSTNKTAMDLLK
jgi:flagellar basal body rod protein FlgG